MGRPEVELLEDKFFGFSIKIPIGVSVGIIIVLTIIAGTMAGLVLCVFSLDVSRLNGIAQGQNIHDAELARRLLAILEKPHWLLIALLTWNDIALETIPLIMNTFLNPVVAVIASVAITIIFCEIIPQAIFIHNAFEVCGFLSSFIKVVMWITSPIAWPISLLMDAIVGDKEAVFFQRRELREIIRIQDELREKKRQRRGSISSEGRSAAEEEVDVAELSKEEITLMLNVLSLSETVAKDMLQRSIDTMYKLHADSVITRAIVNNIFSQGYSFTPIYNDAEDPNNVTHILMTNMLLLLIYRSENEGVRVKDLALMPLKRFSGSSTASNVFIELQTLCPPIVAITDESSERVIGLLSLRNVSEWIHETTFQAEMDPRHVSPLQTKMRTWRTFYKVGEPTTHQRSLSPSRNLSFSLHSSARLADASLRTTDSLERQSIILSPKPHLLRPPSPPTKAEGLL